MVEVLSDELYPLSASRTTVFTFDCLTSFAFFPMSLNAGMGRDGVSFCPACAATFSVEPNGLGISEDRGVDMLN